MRKFLVTTLFLVLNINLSANSKLFDYDVWAKDLKVMIELSSSQMQTLKGSDKNNNMVRDDVENYIKDKYKNDKFQKVMFLEAAKKIQQILTLTNKATKATHKQLDDELLQIYTCRDYILYKNNDIDVEKELKDKIIFKSKVLNTKERLDAYLAHKKVIPFDYSLPTNDILKLQREQCVSIYKKIKNENADNLSAMN